MTNLRDFLSTHDPVPQGQKPATVADARQALAAAKNADDSPALPRRTPRRLGVLAGVAAAAVACAVSGGVVTAYLQSGVTEESSVASGHNDVGPASGTSDPAQLSTPEAIPTKEATLTGPAHGVVVEKDTPANGKVASGTTDNTLPLTSAAGRWQLTSASHQGTFSALDTGISVMGTVTSASDEELSLTLDGLCGPFRVTLSQQSPGVFDKTMTQGVEPSCTDAQRDATNMIGDILGAGTFTIWHTQQRLVIERNNSSLLFTRP